MVKNRSIVYLGKGEDWPVAIVGKQELHNVEGGKISNNVVDPIFNWRIQDNLYGRIMTLLEATIENQDRLKAVKNIFGKELRNWAQDVYSSAREIAEGGDSSHNLYSRASFVEKVE